MRRAWAPLLFEDKDRAAKRRGRDPILPAKPSKSARQKKSSGQTSEGLPVQSFQTPIAELGSRARMTYGVQWEESDLTFQQVPEPTPRMPERTSCSIC